MRTYRKTYPGADYVSQSRVVHSGEGRGRHRWSVQLMRKRHRHGGRERRGFTVFVSAGRLRGELGTR